MSDGDISEAEADCVVDGVMDTLDADDIVALSSDDTEEIPDEIFDALVPIMLGCLDLGDL